MVSILSILGIGIHVFNDWIGENDGSVVDCWISRVSIRILFGDLVFQLNSVFTEWIVRCWVILFVAFDELLDNTFLVNFFSAEWTLSTRSFKIDKLIVTVLVKLVVRMAAKEFNVSADFEFACAKRA